jgi:hypothetical protein
MNNFLEYYDKYKNEKKLHIIEIESVQFMMREITWKEGMLIDAKSFRKNDEVIYQSSEYEKREILSIALIRAYDTENQVELISNSVENLLDKIDYSAIETLWVEYQQYLYLSADEANFYFIATKKYFDPNNRETYPVPPIIVEIDYMTRGLVSMSKDEFNNLTMKEFETLQLIIAIKNEVKKESGAANLDIDLDKEFG